MKDILFEGLKQLEKENAYNNYYNIDYDKLLLLLRLYIKEIKMFNKSFNLVKTLNDNELIVSHILDSLSAHSFFYAEIKKTDKIFYIADVGSGAGFPGIPLACFFSSLNCNNVKIKLIERMEKRFSFLQNVKAILNLDNIEVLETDIEKVNETSFDIVTCRAFKPLDKNVLHQLLKCTKQNGFIFLYKAKEKKIMEEVKLIQNEELLFRIEPLYVPFLNKERRLLIIHKDEKKHKLQVSK